MPISTAEYTAMLVRTSKQRIATMKGAADREVGKGGLQEQIADWCRNQWPTWKVIQARPDRQSTIALGAQDFSIFAPGGRVFCIETKAAGKKQSKEQLIWAKQMEMLGHTVHLVYSFEEFLAIVQKQTEKPNT